MTPCREKKGRTPFAAMMAPPTPTGHLHIGHALNRRQDMIGASHQKMGFEWHAYTPGWDCHGLPIEWKIEEQYRQKCKTKTTCRSTNFPCRVPQSFAAFGRVHARIQNALASRQWPILLTMDFFTQRGDRRRIS